MNASVIVFSFIASMTAAMFILNKKKKKSISFFSTHFKHVTLGVAFSLLYTDEMKTFRLGDSKIYYLVIASPIITWANALVLQFIRPKHSAT